MSSFCDENSTNTEKNFLNAVKKPLDLQIQKNGMSKLYLMGMLLRVLLTMFISGVKEYINATRICLTSGLSTELGMSSK